MSIEKIILSNLVYNEDYTRKVIPFLKSEYFSDPSERKIYEIIDNFFIKYNSCPSIEALAIDLSKESINENEFKSCKEIISNLEASDNKPEWLIDNTEKFCQEKALYNGIMKSINIMDDKSGKSSPGLIPQILSDALAVSFDSRIGHDFLEDGDKLFDYLHSKTARLEFDLDYFNKITEGGLPNKTLTVFLAGIHVGKSMTMCHCAGNNLSKGNNVLYITLEMSEEEISKRIYANLTNTPLKDLISLPKDMYDQKIERLKSKTTGKLIVREFPTASANAANFRYLLNELKIKKNFIPDIIYIDYINLCLSTRYKHGSSVNSYTIIKAIAEELRGLAVEYNLPIVTATQLTRSGLTSSDVGMEDTAESIGLPATVDLMLALIRTDELRELNQMLVKQLKNRLGDINFHTRFVIGVDNSRMRLYDVEQDAQTGILDNKEDVSVMDKTAFGQADSERKKKGKKFDFGGFG